MKKFLFLSLLTLGLSVTAANVSSSPPVLEQSIVFEIPIVEFHYDAVSINVEVEFFALEMIQNNFNFNGVFAPEMRSGFVYHPLDYESANYAIIPFLAVQNKSILFDFEERIKCRTDIFPSVSIKVFS
jgi:hypothetical protein